MKQSTTRWFRYTFLTLLAVLIVIQTIPYGRNRTNPPVLMEPHWDTPATRNLAKRACFDCHSNETVWPWYTMIAPISWLIYRDVEEGRRELNFSEWQGGTREGEKPAEIREQIEKGEMPPALYRMMHAEARLSDAEKRQLSEGLADTASQPIVASSAK